MNFGFTEEQNPAARSSGALYAGHLPHDPGAGNQQSRRL